MDLTKVDLSSVLSPATVMVLTVTGSTSAGSALSAEALQRVLGAVQKGVAVSGSAVSKQN